MKELKILVFGLNEELYATDIMEVERILGYEVATELPESPDFLDGVIQYEDGVLPIINLDKKFKLKNNTVTDESRVIVVKKEVDKFGILVDNVSEVISIKDTDIDNPKTVSTLVPQKYIKGLVKKGNRIIIMLDLLKILTKEEEAIVF